MTKTELLNMIDTAKNSNDQTFVLNTLSQLGLALVYVKDEKLKAAYNDLYNLAYAPEG